MTLKSSIRFLNHASVHVTCGEIGLLCDPWYEGDAFHKGWNLIYENPLEEINEVLGQTSHIWLSHEHPDHFSVAFFKRYGDVIREKGIKLLFQTTDDQRVVKFLHANGFKVQELRFDTPTPIGDDFSVTCLKDGFYDSGLLMECAGEKILNLNDCEVTTPPRASEVYAVVGDVDVLLTQFSFAAWKGGEENKIWREEAAAEKLKTMVLQIETFKPRYTVPFASFVYFSNTQNFYLNDSVNTPKAVLQTLAQTKGEIVVMKPGDILGGAQARVDNDAALTFWDTQYASLGKRDLNSFETVSYDSLATSFLDYRARILKANSGTLIRLVRKFSPIKAFQPVPVRVEDLGMTVMVDYLTETLRQTNEKPLLSMQSESLSFLLKNSFGFDTLTVNGCFEEAQSGGFILATKTLAIENLNNMGIRFSLSTLFNVRIIKLFITRLNRVARKLDA